MGIVNFAQALELKSLGFDTPTLDFYGWDGTFYELKVKDEFYNHNSEDIRISAPTVDVYNKWLLDNKNVETLYFLSDDYAHIYDKYFFCGFFYLSLLY